jgi:hypothetical protein
MKRATSLQHKIVFPLHQRGKPGAFDHTPASRWEQLCIQMNQKALDPGHVRGTGTPGDPMAVWAALGALDVPEVTKHLLVYMATQDRKARAAVWVFAFNMLMTWREQEAWNTKEKGVCDMMALHAIFHTADPHLYEGISQRKWAEHLGIACHKDFKKYWQPRYQRIQGELETMADAGIEKLVRMTGGRPAV